MIPGTVIRVVGAALVVVGLILLGATGAVASALGAQGGAGAVPGASDPASLAFWFQLSFIRLFGTTLIGLGVVLWWCHSHLRPSEHRSLATLLAGVLGAVTCGPCKSDRHLDVERRLDSGGSAGLYHGGLPDERDEADGATASLSSTRRLINTAYSSFTMIAKIAKFTKNEGAVSRLRDRARS